MLLVSSQKYFSPLVIDRHISLSRKNVIYSWIYMHAIMFGVLELFYDAFQVVCFWSSDCNYAFLRCWSTRSFSKVKQERKKLFFHFLLKLIGILDRWWKTRMGSCKQVISNKENCTTLIEVSSWMTDSLFSIIDSIIANY